ncbi:hypothetical protein PYW07_000836 [Mythimna separata]|uniref:NACHT domain-containing protein n=1 Tax=Mythimna separata TaxID=271217 RepID=A0AAD7YR59_MYTSE|nr:hypothetical protein PYW07_000836 [Mythimna separata]
MYSKRKGTSGICGQLYESKLISLLYFRALRDTRIEDFQLASNVDNIGAFDDIYFKARVKGLNKPVLVFIQAKHKENENQTLKNDLVTYFESYLKIRRMFNSNNNDLLLADSFDDTECLFVIYTTARDEYDDDSEVECYFSSHLNDLIGTPRGTAKQPYKNENNIDFLTKIIIKEQVTSLAERIAKFILGEGNSQMMLTDDLIMRYHIILGQKVFEVSDIKPNGQRIAFFRNEFFNTNEEYLVAFKNILFRDILKKRKIKHDDIKHLLSDFISVPTDTTRLSRLIGTVIRYNDGQLEVVKEYSKDIIQSLDWGNIPLSIVNEAVALAAKDVLLSRNFHVPAAFSNKDLTLSGSDAKKEGRLKYISSKIIDLLHQCDSNNIVTVDDSLEKGLLQLNGGIAGAVGNIFVLDDETKLMKITDNCDLLGDLAKKLLANIREKCCNLHKYRFCFKIYKFPKLTLDCSQFEENIARDFLKKLLFYSNQADENSVELILKNEIELYQHGHPNHFKAKTDAIFAKYHDVIQKWWKQPNQAMYLTREPDLFNHAINNIIRDPLMSSLNVTYMSKIKHCNYTFSEDAVESLRLQDQLSNTLIIITENSVMTVLKVVQYFKNNEHIILDFEYIVNLPESDRNALLTELRNTNDDRVFIFLFEQTQNSRSENNISEIAKAIKNNKTIIVTNELSVKISKKYFPEADNIICDKKVGLVNMSQESQKIILENARVIFQGIVVPLNFLVDDESMMIVAGVILGPIINGEAIEVGKLTVDRNYDEIKYLYVHRRVTFSKYFNRMFVHNLNDITHDVVLLTAEPGMGKSTLLSHLSVKTKEVYPEIWIVRINLLEYSRQFSQWKEAKTAIDILETLKFLCQVVIRDKFRKENNIQIVLEDKNDSVYLKHCTGDQWIVFELKLFLHFYNKRKMIFLFDGFDEICPHYTSEVINCLKSIRNDPRKQRMWITSRSYNEVKIILLQEFGSSYNIDYFLYAETEEYLQNYLNFNFRLDELNNAQLKNVEKFLKYMVEGKDITVLSEALPQRPLHRVYNSASKYLLDKISHVTIPSWTHNLTNVDISCIKSLSDLFASIYYENKNEYGKDNRCGNPLYLFLAAYYFVDNIKNYTTETKGWDLEMHLSTFYEWFLKTTIKKRYQEKNKMDIYNPDIISAYDKDLADSVARYKKLAAYAIFRRRKNREIFNSKDLEEIKDWIKFIEKGGEKTGIIYSVANEIPIFIHMTFTENFAVEYICDCLKNEKDQNAVIPWIKFIIHVFFSKSCSLSLKNMLDLKLKFDETLISVLNKHNDVLFNSLMKKISKSKFLKCLRYNDSYLMECSSFNPLPYADYSSMEHFMRLLSFTLNKSNVNEFLKMVNQTKLLPVAIGNGYSKLPALVFDLIRKYDKTQLKPVLLQNFSYLSPSMNFDEMKIDEILKHIHDGFLEGCAKT